MTSPFGEIPDSGVDRADTRIMRKLLNILLLICTIITLTGMTIVAVEYGLRHFTNEETGKVLFIPHPTAFVTLKPDIEKTVNAGNGQQYSVRTNEIGTRDDHPFCKNANILLFGDSNLFAAFLPYSRTLGEQLEALYNNTICSINFGVPGYGPDQSLLRMKYEIERLALKPQVIVFHIFADNDYGDLFRNNIVTTDELGNLNLTGRKEPDYKLGWLERLQARSLIARRLRDLLYKAGYHGMPENEYIPDRTGAYLNTRLPTQASRNNFIRRFEGITQNEFIKYKQGKHTTWLGDIYDYHIALSPGSEAAVRAQALMTAIIRDAKRVSDTVNACLIVLIQPSEWDVATTGPVTYLDLQGYSAQYNRDYNRRNLVNIAMRAAVASGASYINLFDLYSEENIIAYNRTYIGHGNNHWNANGIQIAANALFNFIDENRCLK